MPRRPRGNDLEQCRCTICANECADGVLQSPHTLSEHLRQEQIRNAVRLAISTTSEPVTRGADNNLSPRRSHRAENNGDNLSTTIENEVGTSADDQYFDALQDEIESRLTLQYCENTLEFVNVPSPDIPFLFPDPVNILHFNSGQFALNIRKACNRRFLENESQFCSLLRDVQKLPPDASRERLEEALFSALEHLHQFKSAQYSLQAYPNGRDGKTYNNCTKTTFYLGDY
ncbi:hypothetical protein GYMLUDRAFT_62288 [Collybiopsis luxurians FD-317 M1]|uniref:Unplaced genomic scaffold GYMLUscaffold_53, whole genome shotgun sequence n=1 Tax=Collybiopsis luxurians FD-317 M1 TaxID=944289 RepID=A0A0D0CDB5_9AGAR|nr:hypothetical protein GYMLUDRAFT_62288 [Collybiopsis luxurians FD-317 M1]